jgi:outer membrane receptor protein involved in Fe transport
VFTRAHHIVGGYDLNITQNFRLKAESYYQYLFDVPVETTSSNYSILNLSSFQQFSYDTLTNKGHGRNYGIEMTLEQFLNKGFYFLVTASVYDSKYKGSDGVLRPTAFDSKYITNLVGGKEFRMNRKNQQARYKTWISVDTKLTAAGGLRYTPVDVDKSNEAGYTVYDESQAFSKQFKDYFRLDLRIAYRLDARRVSHELAIDVQNITNHKNPIYMQYNPNTGQEEFMYQLEFFPMAQYRITF